MKPEWIEAPGDPRLRDYCQIRDRTWLRERGLFVAEGRGVLATALGSPHLRVESVLLTPATYQQIEDELLDHPDVRVLLCAHATMRTTSGVPFHQGCVALVRLPAPTSFAALLSQLRASTLRVLAIEDVTDPDNIGSLFRNALAFGVDAVVLSPRCASPYYRKSIRTSLGATLRVAFIHEREWPGPLDRLAAAGFLCVALTPARSAEPLASLPSEIIRARRVALCVGNEGEGLSAVSLRRCTRHVRIPMHASADSLNVATAAAIALHHFHREEEGEGGVAP